MQAIQEFNAQLEAILKRATKEAGEFFAITVWHALTGGSPNIAKLIQGTHPTVYAEFLGLAYSLRYPNEHSEITPDEMFEALKRPIPPAITFNDRYNESLDFDWSAAYAQLGFQSEYLKSDTILDPVLKTLRENAAKWAPKDYKAPYTAIIGPTMSGKTRLIMEIAKKVPVVYICLRPECSTGLPSRSKLADHLLPETRPADPQLHYAILLVAILRAVTDFFTRENIVNQDQEAQVTAWYKHSFPTDGKTDDGKFAAEVKLRMDKLQGLAVGDRFPTLQDALRIYSELCITQDSRLKIILAIDEARGMLELKGGSEISPFRHLRRVLSQITVNQGFFALFTDTTSRVANFCPALQYDRSARLYDLGWDLFDPIFRLETLDLFASKPDTLNELSSPSRLLNYGTPFYGPYFQVVEKSMGTAAAINQVIMIAQHKLIFTKPLTTLSQAQIFALIGPIIQPPLYTAWDLNAELLSSHAAHCMYISPARDKVVCQYPSQPVYASAAHRFLASDDAKWVACINGLTLAVQQGLVSIGDAGELAANLILIWAMNQTMKKVADKKKPIPSAQKKKSRMKRKNFPDREDSILSDDANESIPYGHPVRLKDFLEVLTGKEADQIDLGSTEKELKTKNRLLNEGIIFFNHLILIKYTPDANDFLEYFYRGVAVQCKPRQPGFDQLFTIYLEPKSSKFNSQKLDAKHISYCGIQVKNHQGSIKWAESYKWTTKYAEIKDAKNPYLVILFNLSGSIPKQPKSVNQDDPDRVLLQIHGLAKIGCLTAKISDALDELKNAEPDLMRLHKEDAQAAEWINSINPQAYRKNT